MPSRIRSVAADTPNHRVAAGELHAALAARLPAFAGLLVKGDVLTILFDSEPTAQDETALDAELAAHDGVPAPRFRLLATSKLVLEEKAITQTTTWEDLGGAVVAFGSLLQNMAEAVCCVVGQVSTKGAGAELRILQAYGTTLDTKPFALRDTAGAWSDVQLSSDQPPDPRLQLFRLQGRLNGATAASMRFVDLALLRTG